MREKPAPNPCFRCLTACPSCPNLPDPKRRELNRALVALVKSGALRFEVALAAWKGEDKLI